MLSETTEMSDGSSELRIPAVTGEDVLALEKLSVFAFGVVHFEGYRNTAPRKLYLGSCGIDSSVFMEVLPNLELLDINNSRVEDIASLMVLPKPRYLCYTGNVIRSIGLLKDRGIAPVE